MVELRGIDGGIVQGSVIGIDAFSNPKNCAMLHSLLFFIVEDFLIVDTRHRARCVVVYNPVHHV